jgi:hypothetical protein
MYSNWKFKLLQYPNSQGSAILDLPALMRSAAPRGCPGKEICGYFNVALPVFYKNTFQIEWLFVFAAD